ncbi:MAG: hypothetical protein GWN30_22275, partial [Gammaproteobacteria bacterium]|nr:hypothetical protein [Gammaproteobacteria bacterium]
PTFNHYTNQTANPNSLSDNKVISIQQDHSGNLWFGTHKVGINKLNRLALRFRNYSHQPDNPQSLCS